SGFVSGYCFSDTADPRTRRPFRGRVVQGFSTPADVPTREVPVDVKCKVLLVEDSKFLRMANERALCRAGYEVSTAADGQEALQVANDKLPDIILLDMLLPKLIQEGAAAYFEKSTLELDKGSNPLAATIETVLTRITHQKSLALRVQELAAKKAAGN